MSKLLISTKEIIKKIGIENGLNLVCDWQQRYIKRLISRGYEKEFAIKTCNAAEIDLETEPESAADDEISYWG